MSNHKSALWQAALDFAAKGWPVFPCLPDAKQPATANGYKDATTDREQIDRWWSENPDYNIALSPEDIGMAVLDLDPDHDPIDTPPTYTVETPRGGEHRYYIGSLPPTVGRLGAHIDTRGQGSYVLVPPSVVGGKSYHVKDNRAAVALPDEVQARIKESARQVEATEGRLDLPGNLHTARTRLADRVRRGNVAVSGSGGNNLTYEVCAELVRDLAISPGMALSLVEEIWNPHCQPPWSREELQTIIDNVTRYGQNAAGAYAAAPASETFAAANLQASTNEGPQPPSSMFAMLGTKEQNELPEPTWLVKEVIPEGRIVLMSAQKGHFKTFLALELALSVAANVETFGVKPEKDGLVVYSAHESLEEIARMHRPAWFAVKGIAQTAETGFYLTQGLHVGFEEERVAFEIAVDAIAAREGRPVRLVVLDTYSAAMASLDENNPTDVTNFIAWARGFLARHPGCALLIVAHKGKDTERGTRGTSAFEYGVDTLLDIERIDNGMQVKVTVRRHRGAPERKVPFHFEGRPVAKSLVFHLLTPEERKAINDRFDPYASREVQKYLRQLGAITDQRAVPTRVLASTIAQQEKDESNERYDARVRETELKLRRLGRTSLQHLTYGSGEKMAWCLPPANDDAELASCLE